MVYVKLKEDSLIVKLIKLANNNPNENEANLAARKVCKMIADADYKFGNTNKPKVNDYANSNIYPRWDDLSPIYDYFRKQREQYEREKQEREKRAEQNKSHSSKSYGPYGPYSYDYERVYNYEWSEPKPKKERRKLKCRTCNKVKETVFIGLEEAFECYECTWNAYTRETMENKK